jgi:hypothetical protein
MQKTVVNLKIRFIHDVVSMTYVKSHVVRYHLNLIAEE